MPYEEEIFPAHGRCECCGLPDAQHFATSRARWHGGRAAIWRGLICEECRCDFAAGRLTIWVGNAPAVRFPLTRMGFMRDAPTVRLAPAPIAANDPRLGSNTA